ncbi:MAG: CHAT domain-containing protein [Candidatus Parabeggiatoa sp.]|nr:CHAT domain-containing protein [Candidatus Parabeggiatoa sp.]
MNTFEITIQRKSTESWPIVVERKPQGVLLPIRHESTFQLNQTDLEELRSLLRQPKDYGTFLGKKLFQGEVRVAFDRAWGESKDGLRILLIVEAEDIELKTLRWERLCAPKDGQWNFLRLDQGLPFSMYIPASTDKRFPPIGKDDLRALVLAASPENLGKYRLDAFDVEASVAGVREALGDIPCEVLAPLSEAIGPPTLDELCRQLTVRQYTLLHFIAHGKVIDGGETALYWANADNQSEIVTGTELISQLKNLEGPRGLPHFAFLSTCESASPKAEGALGGLGQRLVRELGIPAVIAMTEKVTMTTALALGMRFYQQLRKSGHVDLALAEATAGLMGRNDIIVPALFSRLAEQALFSHSLDRDLTNLEIKYGLEQLRTLLKDRAPVLQKEFEKDAKNIQGKLGADKKDLTDIARQEREQALLKMNTLCQEVSDLNFNALAFGQTPPNYEARCPFMGLYPFHAEDREFFFGRDKLIKALQEELMEYQFLAVLGPSGCGKSSLVLAGVVPQMQAQSLELQLAYLTPGSDPLAQFSTAKAQAQNQSTVFVVDQFEELFTLCAVEEERQEFIDQLLSLSQQQPVVITMRADFWGECAPYDALKTQMKARQCLIGPMNTAELRGAMEQQANKVGLRFEADLSNTILDEVKEEAGAMPLLQHGLQELWKRRHGRWLKASEYRNGIGGIKQAIAKTANEFYYNKLSTAEERAQFKSIFIRLTRLDENAIQGKGGRDTCRRVGLEELVPAGGELSVTKKLVKHLADARLVVTSVNKVTQREEVEVAHEALICYWPKLANWLDENRSNLQLRQTIRQAALAWDDSGKTTDDLIHKGVRLEDAKVLARQTGFLNQLEADYVMACVALADAAEMAVRKRRNMTLVSLTAGMIIAIILTCLAFWQWNEANEQTQKAEESEKKEIAQKKSAENERDKALRTQSLFLADLSRQETEKGNATNGLLLALEALPKNMSEPERPVVQEAETQLYKAVSNLRERWVMEHDKSVRYAAFSPNGKCVVTTSQATAYIKDIESDRTLQIKVYENDDWIDYAAINHDCTKVVTISRNQQAILWEVNVKRGQIIKKRTFPSSEQNRVAVFHPNRTEVLIARENAVYLWNIQRGEFTKFIEDNVNFVAFSPDGTQLLTTASYDNVAKLWNSRGERIQSLRHDDVNYAAFNSDGTKVVTVSNDNNAIKVWNWNGEQFDKVSEYDFQNDSKIMPYGVGFTSQDLLVATTSEEQKTIALYSWDWDEKNDKPQYLFSLSGHDKEINHLAFSPSGKNVITVSNDKTARLWDMHLKNRIDTDRVEYAAYDGTQIITASRDEIRLWNAKNGQFVVKAFSIPQESNYRLNDVAINSDYSRIITVFKTGFTNTAYLSEKGQFLKKFEKVIPGGIKFTSNGLLLITSSESVSENKTELHYEQGDQFVSTLLEEEYSNYATFNSDGTQLITVTGNEIFLWEISNKQKSNKTSKLLTSYTSSSGNHNIRKVSVCFKDNQVKKAVIIPYSDQDKHVTVWNNDPNCHSSVVLKDENKKKIQQAILSPDCTKVATISYEDEDEDEEQIFSLWDAEKREILSRYELKGYKKGYNQLITHMAFTPSGKKVLTVSEDKIARLLPIFNTPEEKQALIDCANKIVPRHFSEQQCKQFFLEPECGKNKLEESRSKSADSCDFLLNWL